MAIDLEGVGRENANFENEDIDMHPGSSKQVYTPDAKKTNNDGTPVSSQKDHPPALKPSNEVKSSSKPSGNSPSLREATSLADESQREGSLKHHTTPLHSSVKVLPSRNSAPPTELADAHTGENRLENTDLITFTPPSQRDCRNNAHPLVSLASGQLCSASHMPRNTDQAKDAATGLANGKGKAKGKQTQKTTAAKHRDEPLIHAAKKRSGTASVNDETQICIDITGGNDEIDPDGTPETVAIVHE